ncbi:site-specific integrase [Segatella sp.]
MSRNKKTSESLFQFMNLLIVLLLKNGQYRTSLHYKATLNSFKRYRDNRDIALSEIDADVMRSYEAYLHHTAEVCKNTSSFYLRILRATYNKAVAKRLTPQQHPFTNVYTGIAPTRKRAIPTEDVSQIKRLHSVKELTPKEEMARDTFLMSFYLRGISFIDLAHLRKSDLKDGFLHYTRRKTGQRLTIRWEDDM